MAKKKKADFAPESQSETMKVAAPGKKPDSMSELIRQVMVRLGDPSVKSPAVRQAAMEWFPEWRERIKDEKFWASYVTQQRSWVAQELGVERKKRGSGGGSVPKDTLVVKDYEDAQIFIERFCGGDVEVATELLEFLATTDFIRLRKGIKAWCEMVESTGSEEAAKKVLEMLKKTGGVLAK